MNPIRPLLVVSLVANVALAAFLFSRVNPPEPLQNHDAPAPAIQEAEAKAISRNAASAELSGENTATATDATSAWQKLRGESDTDFVARLRAEGFPPHLIRTIVFAEVFARFAPQRQAIEARRGQQPWWQGNSFEMETSREARREQRTLGREIEKAVEELLGGPQWMFTPEDRARMARQYGDLPPDKIARLQAIERDYGDLASEISAEARGVMLREDRERLALLEEEKRRDLAALLTEDELKNFDLRSSPAARRLQNQLRHFDATEAEYLALFDLRQPIEEQFGGPDARDPESAKARQLAELQLEPQIAAALGPTRYEEYKLTTHPAFNQVFNTADGVGLSREAAFAAARLHIQFSARADAIRTDRTLTPALREAQLAALAEEATPELSRAFGADGFAQYRRSVGRWLNRSPNPPRP